MSLFSTFTLTCDKYSCKEKVSADAEVLFDARNIPVFKVKLPPGWEMLSLRDGDEYRCPSHATPSF